jgi:hydroxyacylglutathione hydrolase
MGMRLLAYRVPPFDNGAYVIADARGDAVVIDPSMGERQVLEAVRGAGLRVLEVLNTHGHPDHTFGDSAVKAATRARLAIHRRDEYRLALNAREGREWMALPHPPVSAERLLEDGDEVLLSELRLVVVHAPGHTEGSSCFHVPQERLLFSGDTIFRGSMGRVDLPGGDPIAMIETLRRLITLPPDTTVYPGHGPATTIGAESGWIERLTLDAITPA